MFIFVTVCFILHRNGVVDISYSMHHQQRKTFQRTLCLLSWSITPTKSCITNVDQLTWLPVKKCTQH